jgi:hypothetical protein
MTDFSAFRVLNFSGRKEEWLSWNESLRIKLEPMGSVMTDDQFIVQVLNSLTSDYKLQMLLLEKQIGNKENPLSIEE